ncbi:cadmium resistance transporter [Nocardia sp. bgisy118]|uniref:cadmium resistance transporter n=1 Tax=Nocardia sp. bgisy118 TaxID=3413786 RepID=UPI003F49D09E
MLPYLGLLPLMLGLRAAWNVWRRRDDGDADGQADPGSRPGVLSVAAVTFANGGDNIGVYVPVFATTGNGGLIVFSSVFKVTVVTFRPESLFTADFHPGVASVSTVVTPGISTANPTVGLPPADSFGTRNTNTADPPLEASDADTVTWARAVPVAPATAIAAATAATALCANAEPFIDQPLLRHEETNTTDADRQ